MSFLSGLFGDRRPVSQTNPSDHPTSANVFSSTSFSPTTSQTPSQPGPSNFSQPFNAPAPTALDTFSTSFDPARLHPLAGLGTDKLDFLQLDEDKLTDVQGATSVLPSRGWTDDLCVGTGTTYLSGEFGSSQILPSSLQFVRPGCRRDVGSSRGRLSTFGQSIEFQTSIEQRSKRLYTERNATR